MREVVRVKKIPEHEVTQRWYIAEDGTEFAREQDCVRYEKNCVIQAHPVFKTCITGCHTFDECYGMVLYHLRNDEDHEFLLSTFTDRQKIHFADEYEKYGPGWYMYYSESGDYIYDISNLKNFEHYLEETRDDFNRWEDEIIEKMRLALR